MGSARTSRQLPSGWQTANSERQIYYSKIFGKINRTSGIRNKNREHINNFFHEDVCVCVWARYFSRIFLPHFSRKKCLATKFTRSEYRLCYVCCFANRIGYKLKVASRNALIKIAAETTYFQALSRGPERM